MSKGYVPEIGDIVMYNGTQVVIVDIKNHESTNSLGDDREYLLVSADKLYTRYQVPVHVIMYDGGWLHVRGKTFPQIGKGLDLAEYAVEPIKKLNHVRKKEKSIVSAQFDLVNLRNRGSSMIEHYDGILGIFDYDT